MTQKRFVSKVDGWLPGVFVAVVLIQIVALAAAMAESGERVGILVGVAVLLLTVALFTWLLRGTFYEVSNDTLRLVCGPFRQRIPISDIQAIEPSRSALSSPALSLDRLRIRYGKNRRVLVSPADKRGFVRALGRDEENLFG